MIKEAWNLGLINTHIPPSAGKMLSSHIANNSQHRELRVTRTPNSILASGDFFDLLITCTNSLDPDQDQLNVGTDLDPNHSTLR